MRMLERLKESLEAGETHYVIEEPRWCGSKRRAFLVAPLQHTHHHHGHECDCKPPTEKDADAYAEAIVQAVLSNMKPNVDPRKPHILELASDDAIIIFVHGPVEGEPGVVLHVYHYDAVRTMKAMKKRHQRIVVSALNPCDAGAYTRRRNDALFGVDVEQMGQVLVDIGSTYVDHWRNIADGEDQVVGDDAIPAADLGGDGGAGVEVCPPDGGEGAAGGGPDGAAAL